MQKNFKFWNHIRTELLTSWKFLSEIANETSYSVPGVTYIARELGINLRLRYRACCEERKAQRLYIEAEKAQARANKWFRQSISNVKDEFFVDGDGKELK